MAALYEARRSMRWSIQSLCEVSSSRPLHSWPISCATKRGEIEDHPVWNQFRQTDAQSSRQFAGSGWGRGVVALRLR
jgi:hypothetical protein